MFRYFLTPNIIVDVIYGSPQKKLEEGAHYLLASIPFSSVREISLLPFEAFFSISLSLSLSLSYLLIECVFIDATSLASRDAIVF